MTKNMEILVNEELLKEKLGPYREACALLLDVFTWRYDYYPVILAAIVTLFFGNLWYLQPSVLTAISICGIISILADLILPYISKLVGTVEEDWTSDKERKFAVFVNRITYYSVQMWNFNVNLEEWKREKPNIYISCVVIFLLFTAWIGNAVNNLILAYLFVLLIVLLPGLLHRNILQIYFSRATITVVHFLGIKTKKT